MSYKAKSILYFASFILAAVTYYNVNVSQKHVADSNELAKADVEQTHIEQLQNDIH